MGDKTGIEWTNFFGPDTGATWNPISANYEGRRGWACVRYDPACDNCYAQLLNVRAPFGMGTKLPYDTQSMEKVELKLINLDQPLRWKKPRGVFTCSMTDLFGSFVPETWRRSIFTVMGMAKQHVFVTLTKRISDMVEWYVHNKQFPGFMVEDQYRTPAFDKYSINHPGLSDFPFSNVIVGITVGHQKTADKAKPYMSLLRSHYPGMKIMISYEPAIGPVDWSGWEDIVSWMVAGGESGDNARTMHPDWARYTRDWSIKNNVPFFFKQWGQNVPRFGNSYNDLIGFESIGKKHAGHMLDGEQWHQFPTI